VSHHPSVGYHGLSHFVKTNLRLRLCQSGLLDIGNADTLRDSASLGQTFSSLGLGAAFLRSRQSMSSQTRPRLPQASFRLGQMASALAIR
jgi:hypothetical protein